jgi:hypothetical protein
VKTTVIVASEKRGYASDQAHAIMNLKYLALISVKVKSNLGRNGSYQLGRYHALTNTSVILR